MPAAAKKNPPPPPEVVEPVIPDARLPLHDCIEARRKAALMVEKQHAALSKASEQIEAGYDEIERLEKAVPLAVEADEKRAASVLKNPKGTVAVGWSADQARSALRIAQERQAMTERARERLKAELRDLEDEVATCDNAVLVAIKAIAVPSIEKLLSELAVDRKRVAISTGILTMLLGPDKGAPSFHNALRSIKAGSARDAVVVELKKHFQEMQYTAAQAEHWETIQAAVGSWTAALGALRQDAAAELPKVV